MRSKSVLLLVVALGCGVVASVAVSQVVLNQGDRPEIQTVGVLVASRDLSAALKVPIDGFRIEQWPADRVPMGAITDPKIVENKFLKQRLYSGEPFIEAKLSNKGKGFSVPAGFRIFDIPVKDESGGGGYIGPGDRVDVFGYFDKSSRIQKAKSVKVMENLEVVMIDGVAVVDPEATSQKKSSTIQLLVKDSQYIVLDTAANLGNLRLALRPPEQTTASSAREDNGESFMEWLKQSETSQDSSVLSMAENVPAAPQKKSVSETHEMTIISSTKSTKYKMMNGQMVVQKENDSNFDETAPAGGYESSSYSSYASPFKTNPATGGAANSGSSVKTTPPVDPDNAAQPNLTWDPSSGVWQSGGFKATYPGSK